ncbi:hypothetical protein OZX56_07600 [Lactobacillus sp. ESL0684]|uniref:hypothetical protein n=1 Tax=unclassified Lactobacillus TaxID=2620435 RepID=UPI0023F62959|nr:MULTISPECIES: hypothetical protein [unclassified Lactobacillus]WEV40097.1 hypothetical protein OZX59_07775 [Lactobacillus sp. ESL0681]WEV43358.1 hypothetical protein OZX56_07600 [Lactobacillus sp. ESL0684]
MKDPLTDKIQQDFAHEKTQLPVMKDRKKTKSEWLVIMMNLLVGAGILIGIIYPLFNLK